jgi:hypothetical protein
MARDDFSKQTVEVLADRAGNRCSNPGCRQPTSGPRTDPDKAVNIGVAAHITAASEGGPRYDATLTPEERRHPDNGLWLCQNCAKLVDNDPRGYPVDLLRTWKQQAEEAARREVEQRRGIEDEIRRRPAPPGRPRGGPVTGTEEVNIAGVRILLREAFTAEGLQRFLNDRPLFRPILNDFGPKFSLEDMIDAVLDHCGTRLLFPELLAEVEAVNPRQYEQHRANLYVRAPGG